MADSFGIGTTIIRIPLFSSLYYRKAACILSPSASAFAEKDLSRLLRHFRPQRLRCLSSMVVSLWIISLRRPRKPTVLAIDPNQPDPVYKKRPRRGTNL